MKASLTRRLSWIELVLADRGDPEAIVVDFNVFSDDDLERLEAFAIRRNSWTGDDWVESGLSAAEREELDALVGQVN